MRYYAHYGHKDFILCLGYGASAVKEYLLPYKETRSNNFVMRQGGADIEMLDTDIADWTITFVNTGQDSSIGERLRRVRRFVADDEMFLANYADVLTDAPLDDMIGRLSASDAQASMLAVKPQAAFHVVKTDPDDRVLEIHSVNELPLRENGGYFVMRPGIFDVLEAGDDLVTHALPRLVSAGALLAYPYDGFWMAADTVKERLQLESMSLRGIRPWAPWDPDRRTDIPWNSHERRGMKDRRHDIAYGNNRG